MKTIIWVLLFLWQLLSISNTNVDKWHRRNWFCIRKIPQAPILPFLIAPPFFPLQRSFPMLYTRVHSRECPVKSSYCPAFGYCKCRGHFGLSLSFCAVLQIHCWVVTSPLPRSIKWDRGNYAGIRLLSGLIPPPGMRSTLNPKRRLLTSPYDSQSRIYRTVNVCVWVCVCGCECVRQFQKSNPYLYLWGSRSEGKLKPWALVISRYNNRPIALSTF